MEIELSPDNIPNFLKSSDLYKNFDFSEEDNVFRVPTKYIKYDTKVNSIEDLINLIHVIRFWLIEDIPDELYDFVMKNDDLDYSYILEEFDNMKLVTEIKILTKIVIQIDTIIKFGCINFLKYFHRKFYTFNENSIYSAIDSKQFEIFEYLINSGCKVNALCIKRVCQDEDSRYLKMVIDKCRKILLKIPKSESCEFWSLQIATKSGKLENMKLLHQIGFEKDISICQIAACYGFLECLKFAHKNGYPWDNSICSIAIENYNLNCLKYAHENGCDFDSNYISRAVGNLEMLKYIHANGGQFDIRFIDNCLKLGGSKYGNYHLALPSFKYAHENNFPIDPTSFSIKVFGIFKNQNYEFIKYLIENNFEYPEKSLWHCCYLAKSDNIDFYNFAISKCSRDKGIILSVLKEKKNRDFLNFIIEHDCELDEEVFASAVYFGEINLLKYLYEKGCPWDEQTSLNAVKLGNLQYLKYAIENGCPCNEEAAEFASLHQLLDILKYLVENNYPVGIAMKNSLKLFNIDCIKLLHENNVAWENDTVECLIESNSRMIRNDGKYSYQHHNKYIHCKEYYECLKYVLDNGAPCDDRMLELAAELEDFPTLQLLHEKGFKFRENFCEKILGKLKRFSSKHAKCLNFAIENGCAKVEFPEIVESDSDNKSNNLDNYSFYLNSDLYYSD